MGIINGLMGNATEADLRKVEHELEQILVASEKLEKAYKLIRDLIVFTNKRLIFIDKQGVTGKKVEYHSIPYHSISHFSIETSGHFDLDAELKIWISSHAEPITKQFRKDKSITEVQKALAEYALR